MRASWSNLRSAPYRRIQIYNHCVRSVLAAAYTNRAVTAEQLKRRSSRTRGKGHMRLLSPVYTLHLKDGG